MNNHSKKKTSYQKNLAKTLRKEGHCQRLGLERRCLICGEAEVESLTTCGREFFERHPYTARILQEHHLAGNHIGPTVTVCLNHHAKLTDLQYNWEEELRKKMQNPLEFIAALIRSLGEFLRMLGEKLIAWALVLIACAGYLLGVNKRVSPEVISSVPLPPEVAGK